MGGWELHYCSIAAVRTLPAREVYVVKGVHCRIVCPKDDEMSLAAAG